MTHAIFCNYKLPYSNNNEKTNEIRNVIEGDGILHNIYIPVVGSQKVSIRILPGEDQMITLELKRRLWVILDR